MTPFGFTLSPGACTDRDRERERDRPRGGLGGREPTDWERGHRGP